MLQVAFRLLSTRPLRAAIALVALLIATVGFQAVLFTARANQAHVQGVIAANWNPPYDLLVHSPSVVPGLTPGDRHAQPTYLDTAHGGVTMKQVGAIRSVPGVSVAAPLGVVAIDSLWFQDFAVDLSKLSRTGSVTVYRISTSYTTDGGQSRIPGRTEFATLDGSDPPFVAANVGPRVPVVLGDTVVDCPNYYCYGNASLLPYQGKNSTFLPLMPLWASARYPYVNPLTTPIVAVDPLAERQLWGVERCLTAGRNLTPGDRPLVPLSATEDDPSRIPVIVNARPGFDERVHATIEASDDAAKELAPLLPTLPREGGTFTRFKSLSESSLNALSYHVVENVDTDLNASWGATEGVGFSQGSIYHPAMDESQQLVAPAQYTGAIPKLTETPVPAPDLDVTNYDSSKPVFQSPIDESSDTAVRSLQRLTETTDVPPWHAFTIVGKYDPACVSRNTTLAGSAFDIYSNAQTRTPDGTPIGPNASVTNLVATMPLIMTNLAGGQFFSDHARFSNGLGDAFLSVVRVRVDGTNVPGPGSEARLGKVATDIHNATGLTVDIIKGSSTVSVSVTAPAGRYGRPAETLEQDWLAENVAISFYNAISRTSLVMAAVVAVVAALLTSEGAYATVRRRRHELLLLRALGWPSWRIGLLVELELVVLGCIIATAALAVAALLIAVGHPEGDIARWLLLAGPIGLGLAALMGLGPAIGATRLSPMRAIRGPGRIRASRVHMSAALLGLREALTTWRWQTMLGVLTTGVSAAFLGAVLSLSQHFRSSLDTSALGDQLAAEVAPYDVALGVIAVVLGTLTAVSVVLVSTQERLPHFATLRALGWPPLRLARVVLAQALTVGLGGGLVGTLALSLMSWRVQDALTTTVVTTLAPLAVGLACGGIAGAIAVFAVYRRTTSEVLRGA